MVQFSSAVSDSLRPPWTTAHQASLSFTISQSLLKFMSIRSVMPLTISSSVVPFSSCLQSFPASGSFQMSQLFTSGPKYWSFSFNVSPSNEGVRGYNVPGTGLWDKLDKLSQVLNRAFSYCCLEQCLTLCDPMNCSTRGFPVLHYLPEFAQIHVH